MAGSDAAGAALVAPLTGGGLDRAAALRDRPEALAAALASPEARALAYWRGRPAALLSEASGQAGPRLAWAPLAAVATASRAQAFLGLEGGAARVAIDLSDIEDEADARALLADAIAAEAGLAVKTVDLRTIAADLPSGEAATAAQARSLLEWRRTHRYCACCGAASAQAQGGWRADCPACGAKHFPRTDPVVIMLTLGRGPDGAERALIGRQNGWPEGLFSLLAGYVEPGETIEEAARREIAEEAGLRIGRVGYLASQPWPFPSTLMLGVLAEALESARDETLTIDTAELETARWIDRAEALAALEGRHPTMAPPRRDAIARTLLEAWARGALTL